MAIACWGALSSILCYYHACCEVYSDSAYTDYTAEDDLEQSSQIVLEVMPKNNSKCQDQS